MMVSPTVTPDARFEQIDEATAQHLGLRPRRFVEEGGTTVLLTKVQSVWIETPLPSNWTAAYRVIRAGDGRVAIGELRLLPAADPGVRTRPGTGVVTWRGVDAPAATPLGVAHLRALRAAPHAQCLRDVLDALTSQVTPPVPDSALAVHSLDDSNRRTDGSGIPMESSDQGRRAIDLEPSAAESSDDSDGLTDHSESLVDDLPDWDRAIDLGDRDQHAAKESSTHDADTEAAPSVEPPKKPRRGRPPVYSDADLARIAADFIEALERGASAIREVATRYSAKPTTIRGLIARNRAAGLHSDAGRGTRGATLTPRAIQLLETQPVRRLKQKLAGPTAPRRTGGTRRPR